MCYVLIKTCDSLKESLSKRVTISFTSKPQLVECPSALSWLDEVIKSRNGLVFERPKREGGEGKQFAVVWNCYSMHNISAGSFIFLNQIFRGNLKLLC